MTRPSLRFSAALGMTGVVLLAGGVAGNAWAVESGSTDRGGSAVRAAAVRHNPLFSRGLLDVGDRSAVAHNRRSSTDPQLQSAASAAVAGGVPGMQVQVVSDGRVAAAAAGSADLETGRRMGVRTKFRVGSQTKTFTAVAVLQLVGQGRLSLSDSVEKWVPGLVPNGDRITLRHLLQMQSGLFSYTDDPAVVTETGLADPRQHFTARELVQIAAKHDPLFAPGTDFSYSNTNFVLAGLIAETAGGRPIDQLITDGVFRRAGMRDSSVPTGYPGTVAGMARGYVQTGTVADGWVDYTDYDPSWAGAAGAAVSSLRDMDKFYDALFGGKLLRPSELTAMTTDTVDASAYLGDGVRYGLGIYSGPLPCGGVA